MCLGARKVQASPSLAALRKLLGLGGWCESWELGGKSRVLRTEVRVHVCHIEHRMLAQG